ncbi:MAG: hypothetical protein TEF_17300 [Rhizobiales bacterium NRL2]|jgi:hypothetical protein|nr:MAG: hypothetical protein TEF_17300 [Rhizobiales bacterium NRL2]
MKLPFGERTNLWIHRRYRELLWPNYGLHSLYLAARGRRVEPSCADLTVEGFGRSGNTYVVHALELSQQRPLRIISHFHYPIAVGRPARAGVPVCLVLRHPLDSIASYCQYSDWSPQRFIDDFVAYHTYVRPYLDSICVARFEDFTVDFNCLVRAMNGVYGPILDEVEDQNGFSDRVFRRIEARQPGGRVDELRVHRPSELRRRRKPEIVADIEANYGRGMAEVMALYDVYRQRAEALQPA